MLWLYQLRNQAGRQLARQTNQAKIMMNSIKIIALAHFVIGTTFTAGDRVIGAPLSEKFQLVSGTIVEGLWISGLPNLNFARISDQENRPKKIGISEI
jgi:hypothetical protein